MHILDPDKVDTVVLHVTASHFGNVKLINDWHKRRGWSMIGYHFLITNVFPEFKDLKDMKPQIKFDGQVFEGRPTKFKGAHVKGYNSTTLGIALVGDTAMSPHGALFSSKQLHSACTLINDLMEEFPNIKKIKGHTELDSKKGCPLIDMNHFREMYNTINY